jgi:hypothetical protein
MPLLLMLTRGGKWLIDNLSRSSSSDLVHIGRRGAREARVGCRRRTLGGADGPDADADFWRWASSRGVVAVRCESRDVAEGWRGIVATEDIERDAVVLRVPGALLMSARSMNEDTQLCDAFRAYDSSAGAV